MNQQREIKSDGGGGSTEPENVGLAAPVAYRDQFALFITRQAYIAYSGGDILEAFVVNDGL